MEMHIHHNEHAQKPWNIYRAYRGTNGAKKIAIVAIDFWRTRKMNHK